MINILCFSVSSLFLVFLQIYEWSKLSEDKLIYKSYRFYVVLVLMTLISYFGVIFVNAFIKIIMLTFVFIICHFLLFRKRINETIICTIFTQLLLAIADTLSVLFLICMLHIDTEMVKNDFFITTLGNMVVSISFFILSSIPILKKLYNRLVTFTDRISLNSLIRAGVLIIISLNFLMATIYYKLNSIHVILINCLLLCTYTFIMYKSISEKNNNILIKAENDSLIKNLSEYEIMLDRQRIDNHENKNQLLIIKNMIKKNDKSVIKYIDTIVKDEKEDDEVLYTKVKKIPSGGLQGIIYQKMLVMKDKNINFDIDVSRDVRKIDLENFDITENYKLCKIIGVLLDNAIEESDNIDNKHIMISLYEEDGMLVIDISNKFNGAIDLDCIDNEGYTTKGEGHGYGLSLVKKLVSESNNFINERRINKDIFKQIIKVKIK